MGKVSLFAPFNKNGILLKMNIKWKIIQLDKYIYTRNVVTILHFAVTKLLKL